MPSIKPVTIEATAVCKGMELTHGNSFHYLTFELDSGERLFFQVSMKCYMLIIEGDRCIITYRDFTNSPKKKLKSFERIGIKKQTVQTSSVEETNSISQSNEEQETIPTQIVNNVVENDVDED